jgi:hypothetical protein
LPFGLDAVFWQLMGEGIDWMIGPPPEKWSDLNYVF